MTGLIGWIPIQYGLAPLLQKIWAKPLMTRRASLFQKLIVATGSLILLERLITLECDHPLRFVAHVVCAALIGAMRLELPTISGTMPLGFLVVLVGLPQFSGGETLLLGLTATGVHIFSKPRRQRGDLLPDLFQMAVVALGVEAANAVVGRMGTLPGVAGSGIVLPLAASMLFLVTAFPLAAFGALEAGGSLRKVWQTQYLWLLPYYLAGASLAGLLAGTPNLPPWRAALIILPLLFLVYRAYQLQLEMLCTERRHSEDLRTVQMRMIETLAMAIEAKDGLTHDHLQRVTVYVTELGKEIGLPPEELQALRAAALLHDIGKLAVPEHIISKPGRLTPEEFDRMKIHPVVGAEIIERARFPYPVGPIVRAHHEKWDGSGYPYGLKSEEIPIGARILSAVDCLDALASDRQYRRAMPLDQAMAQIVSQSGKSFDPIVVELLKRRYVELESMARTVQGEHTPMRLELNVETNAVPATGFDPQPEGQTSDVVRQAPDFLAAIVAARREEQLLLQLSQLIGNSLNLSETLQSLSKRLTQLIPYETMVLYVRRDRELLPESICGERYDLFSNLRLRVGEGLSGWVAEKRKPIVNGNPGVEPGYETDPAAFQQLKSALALPLEGANGVVAVLTFYSAKKDAFTREHLRLLLAISSKLAISVENSLKYSEAESLAAYDFLTGLPNAGSLFVRLQHELSRCQRSGQKLAVLLCDLDGFKQVNDRFGHLTGNKVLQLVAKGLRQHCREYDFVARLGGDEFVILLPGATADALKQKRRRFAMVAAEAGLELCGEGIISFSIGEANFPGDGVTADELLARADERMYHSKSLQKRMLPGGRTTGIGEDWFEEAVNEY
jgi:diguanylate cyclase (GGDEF)-like protein/putative nucleotidyltransferase with HDIG domain